MGFADSLLNAYYAVEDRWFDLLDWMEGKGIPAYKVVDPIEKHGIPSLPVFAAILMLIVYFLAGLMGGVGGGPGVGPEVRVSFQVQNTTGVSIEHALVKVYDSEGEFIASGYTDPDGLLEIPLAPGDYTLNVSAEQCEQTSQDITVTGQESGPFTITLECVGKQTFEQTEIKISPKNVGIVYYATAKEGTKQKCGVGSCTLTLDADETYVFYAEGYKSDPYEGNYLLQTPFVVLHKIETPKYEEKGKVLVNLVDERRVKIPYPIEVKVVNAKDSKDVLSSGTSSEGSVELKVPAGINFRIIANPKEGNFSYFEDNRTFNVSNREYKEITVVLKEATKTTLFVRDGINPLPGVNVKVLDSADVLSGEGTTAADGSFRTSLRKNAKYNALLYKYGYKSLEVRITGGETKTVEMKRISREEVGTLRVIVRYEEYENAVPGATVTLFSTNGTKVRESPIPSKKTDEAGEALFDWVDPGDYCIKVTKGEITTVCEDNKITIEKGDDETKVIHIPAEKRSLIIFSYIDKGNGKQVLPSAAVQVYDDLGEKLADTETDKGGYLELELRKDSLLRIEAQHKENEKLYSCIASGIKLDGNKLVELVLREANTSITLDRIEALNGNTVNVGRAGETYYAVMSVGIPSPGDNAPLDEVKVDLSLPECSNGARCVNIWNPNPVQSTDSSQNTNIILPTELNAKVRSSAHAVEIIFRRPALKNTVVQMKIPIIVKRTFTGDQVQNIKYNATWTMGPKQVTDSKEYQFKVSSEASAVYDGLALYLDMYNESGDSVDPSGALLTPQQVTLHLRIVNDGNNTFSGPIKLERTSGQSVILGGKMVCGSHIIPIDASSDKKSITFSNYCQGGLQPGQELSINVSVRLILPPNKESDNNIINAVIGEDKVSSFNFWVVGEKTCVDLESLDGGYNQDYWNQGVRICDAENGFSEYMYFLNSTGGMMYYYPLNADRGDKVTLVIELQKLVDIPKGAKINIKDHENGVTFESKPSGENFRNSTLGEHKQSSSLELYDTSDTIVIEQDMTVSKDADISVKYYKGKDTDGEQLAVGEAIINVPQVEGCVGEERGVCITPFIISGNREEVPETQKVNVGVPFRMGFHMLALRDRTENITLIDENNLLTRIDEESLNMTLRTASGETKNVEARTKTENGMNLFFMENYRIKTNQGIQRKTNQGIQRGIKKGQTLTVAFNTTALREDQVRIGVLLGNNEVMTFDFLASGEVKGCDPRTLLCYHATITKEGQEYDAAGEKFVLKKPSEEITLNMNISTFGTWSYEHDITLSLPSDGVQFKGDCSASEIQEDGTTTESDCDVQLKTLTISPDNGIGKTETLSVSVPVLLAHPGTGFVAIPVNVTNTTGQETALFKYSFKITSKITADLDVAQLYDLSNWLNFSLHNYNIKPERSDISSVEVKGPGVANEDKTCTIPQEEGIKEGRDGSFAADVSTCRLTPGKVNVTVYGNFKGGSLTNETEVKECVQQPKQSSYARVPTNTEKNITMKIPIGDCANVITSVNADVKSIEVDEKDCRNPEDDNPECDVTDVKPVLDKSNKIINVTLEDFKYNLIFKGLPKNGTVNISISAQADGKAKEYDYTKKLQILPIQEGREGLLEGGGPYTPVRVLKYSHILKDSGVDTSKIVCNASFDSSADILGREFQVCTIQQAAYLIAHKPPSESAFNIALADVNLEKTELATVIRKAGWNTFTYAHLDSIPRGPGNYSCTFSIVDYFSHISLEQTSSDVDKLDWLPAYMPASTWSAGTGNKELDPSTVKKMNTFLTVRLPKKGYDPSIREEILDSLTDMMESVWGLKSYDGSYKNTENDPVKKEEGALHQIIAEVCPDPLSEEESCESIREKGITGSYGAVAYVDDNNWIHIVAENHTELLRFINYLKGALDPDAGTFNLLLKNPDYDVLVLDDLSFSVLLSEKIDDSEWKMDSNTKNALTDYIMLKYGLSEEDKDKIGIDSKNTGTIIDRKVIMVIGVATNTTEDQSTMDTGNKELFNSYKNTFPSVTNKEWVCIPEDEAAWEDTDTRKLFVSLGRIPSGKSSINMADYEAKFYNLLSSYLHDKELEYSGSTGYERVDIDGARLYTPVTDMTTTELMDSITSKGTGFCKVVSLTEDRECKKQDDLEVPTSGTGIVWGMPESSESKVEYVGDLKEEYLGPCFNQSWDVGTFEERMQKIKASFSGDFDKIVIEYVSLDGLDNTESSIVITANDGSSGVCNAGHLEGPWYNCKVTSGEGKLENYVNVTVNINKPRILKNVDINAYGKPKPEPENTITFFRARAYKNNAPLGGGILIVYNESYFDFSEENESHLKMPSYKSGTEGTYIPQKYFKGPGCGRKHKGCRETDDWSDKCKNKWEYKYCRFGDSCQEEAESLCVEIHKEIVWEMDCELGILGDCGVCVGYDTGYNKGSCYGVIDCPAYYFRVLGGATCYLMPQQEE